MATDTAPRSRRNGSTLSVGLAGALLLGCGWSVTALGATSLISDCQEFSELLRQTDPPATELSIALVELPDGDAQPGLDKSLNAVGSASDSTTPLLYLSSRVTSMLRKVFDDEATNAHISTPPVAERDTKHGSLPTLEASELPDPADARPSFQRQMYRTDI